MLDDSKWRLLEKVSDDLLGKDFVSTYAPSETKTLF